MNTPYTSPRAATRLFAATSAAAITFALFIAVASGMTGDDPSMALAVPAPATTAQRLHGEAT